ncbi:MAG TPA: hypothetical protein VN026_17950 [Bacteroidia bacterium]|jgi:hypothetical protein|nr:hypothetical protein [Bacteroidia bacterium]
METTITTVKWKHIGYGKYPFAFKKFKFINGFIFRIFIWHIKVSEKNSFEKLMTIWNEHRK